MRTYCVVRTYTSSRLRGRVTFRVERLLGETWEKPALFTGEEPPFYRLEFSADNDSVNLIGLTAADLHALRLAIETASPREPVQS